MKIHLLVALVVSVLVILSFISMVQASTGWSKTYQDGPMDTLTPRSVIQTIDGGYATAVFAYLRQENQQGLSSSYELQILKTDSNGAVQWKKSYPTVEDPNHLTPTINTYSDQYVIVQTADQGYVVAGSGGQFWLFKVNAQGTVVWSKVYTLSDEAYANSYLNSMIQTTDGGFALVGAVDTDQAGRDFWIVKTNSLGVAQWNQTFNSGTYTNQIAETYPCDDEAQCVIQTNDGGYAIVGTNSLYRASTSSIVYATWIVKTDAQGKQVWNHGYDLINEQGYRRIIIQTSDNGYAVAGTQNNDFCLFKIKSSNQFEWSQIYGDQDTDTPCALVQLEDGGYAIAGTWTPTNMTAIRNTMGLIRTDTSGTIIWTKTFTAKQDPSAWEHGIDQAYAMIRTSDGAYALVGSTRFGSEYHQDIFFVKTETLEQNPKTTPLPNPSTSQNNSTQSPDQTAQPSTNPTQPSQTQNPYTTINPNDDSSDNAFQLDNPQNILLIVGVITTIIVITALSIAYKKKKASSASKSVNF